MKNKWLVVMLPSPHSANKDTATAMYKGDDHKNARRMLKYYKETTPNREFLVVFVPWGNKK